MGVFESTEDGQITSRLGRILGEDMMLVRGQCHPISECEACYSYSSAYVPQHILFDRLALSAGLAGERNVPKACYS